MVFTKARQIGLVEHLVEQIEQAIISGKYKPGDKLPPSKELESMLGASRGTLREAFRILGQKGLIEIKTGVKGGAFVKLVSAEAVTESLGLLLWQRQIDIDDLYRFREVIEEGLLRLVIAKAQLDDVREMRALLDEMALCVPRGLPAFRQLLSIERRIRDVMIRCSKSKMYESVLNAIWNNMHSYALRYLPGEEGMLEEGYQDWRIIVESIENGDAEAAAAQIKDHLRRYAQHYKRGFEKYHSDE